MKKIKFTYFLIALIVFSTMVPNFAQAQDFTDKENALGESILYNFETGKLEIVKEFANEKYDFNDSELDYYNEKFNELTVDETNKLLLSQGIDIENYEGDVLYLENNEGTVQPFGVIAILAGIGIVTAIGYFWWDKYLTYKIKQNLIDKCYSIGGSPVFDSRDDSGFKGDPKKNRNYYEISSEGGYNFACERP